MASNAVPVTMTMTQDDAVEVTFVDGSRIQLSPCGANFIYTSPLGRSGQTQMTHPLYASPGIHQRTCFATSCYQSMVHVALEFRNRFAHHPLIFASMLGEEKPLELYADITRAQWPVTTDQCVFDRQQDHSIYLTSIDSLATLALSPCAQDFSLRYLCKLQPQKHSAMDRTGFTNGTLHPRMKNPCVGRQSPHEQRSESICSCNWEKDGKHNDTLVGLNRNSAGFRNKPGVKVCSTCDGETHMHQPCFTERPSHQDDRLAHGNGSETEFVSGDGMTCSVPVDSGAGFVLNEPKGMHDVTVSEHGNARTEVDRSCQMAEWSGTVQSSKCKFQYVWVMQNHSVAHCPWFLREPLRLLLQHHTDCQEGLRTCLHDEGPADEGKASEQGKAEKEALIFTPLPQSLPLSCEHSHLHKHNWRGQQDSFKSEDESDTLNMYGRKVKVMVASGVVYRLFWDTTPSVEIYPGDGSVLLSCDERGSYYKLFRIDSRGTVQEQMISSMAPPPDTSTSKYSFTNILRRGSRLLQCMGVHKRMVVREDDRCCWKKLDEREDIPGQLVESSTIPGIGHLEAFSSGLIRGCFCDGVTLEIKDDSVLLIEGSLHNQEKENSRAVCMATLSDGSVRRIDMKNPGTYSRYLTVLLDWNARVKTISEPPSWDRDNEISYLYTSRIIEAELAKMKCFTYIAELEGKQTVCSYDTHIMDSYVSTTPSKPEHHELIRSSEGEVKSNDAQKYVTFNDAEIQKALLQTTEAVSAIEKYLNRRE